MFHKIDDTAGQNFPSKWGVPSDSKREDFLAVAGLPFESMKIRNLTSCSEFNWF